MKTPGILIVFMSIITLSSFVSNSVLSQSLFESGNNLRITIKTYDSLMLPAQVINGDNHNKKMILFINGSTPYDEKGNQGAIWNNEGKIIMEKHDFYLRFLDIMPNKGYSIATLAKRSFVYPTKIPRPSLTDLALDIQSFIEKLKKAGLLKDEKELVIVGYSEGSVVASKVLSILKKQPYACVLLGSSTLGCDCSIRSMEDFPMADVLHRLKNWNEEQIKTEFDHLCQIQKALLNMDEEEFENEYKKVKHFGYGTGMWESFYINREGIFYNPVPALLYANIPVLICSGEDDIAMPMISAKKTYESLKNMGLDKVTFRVIEKEGHQYKKYDVFSIIDIWLSSEFRTTSFILQKSDSLIIERYAKANELINAISAIPYGGGYSDKIITCYEKATESKITDPFTWFNLGIKLFADGYIDEAYNSFTNANDTAFAANFAVLVWLGHLEDLKNRRKEAIALYQKALKAYPGFPVTHDNWNIVIDKKWIEERIKSPFKGVK
jgi:tetratricopeptide (TPR) repeat protein